MTKVGDAARDEASLTKALRSAVTSYDTLTGRHSQRVGDLAALLAAQLDLDRPDRLLVAHAGVLHDLGKIGISSAILDKPGRLTPAEMTEMQRHPVIGAEMLLAISPDLARMAEGVRAHHERWEGGGYPDGLAGEQIPTFGRLLAVVDVYDAITHPRSYRKTVYSPARARSFIEERSGTHFEPDCVRATLEILREREKARRQFTV